MTMDRFQTRNSISAFFPAKSQYLAQWSTARAGIGTRKRSTGCRTPHADGCTPENGSHDLLRTQIAFLLSGIPIVSVHACQPKYTK
jgi:hypothetical protein